MNFSVLLSVYYKENPLFLEQSLESVFSQTLLPKEVVLVKDGPLTSELNQVIVKFQKQYPCLKIIELNENKGLGYALNEGLKYCSYDWVARMDTDDICYSNRFEEQFSLIQEYPQVSFVGSLISEFEDTIDNIVSYRVLPEKHEDILLYAKTRCPLNHPTVIFRKQAVLDLGGYGHFPEDYHLWVRALMNGYKFYNVQKPLLYFRVNLDTIRRRGGLSYAKIEIKHQREFYKMGFLTYLEYIKNSFVRSFVRLMPLYLRYKVYFKFLRSNN